MTRKSARNAWAEPGILAADVHARPGNCLPCDENLHALAFGIAVLKRNELPPHPDLVSRILSQLEPHRPPAPNTLPASA
jgi:hypothetical protein